MVHSIANTRSSFVKLASGNPVTVEGKVQESGQRHIECNECYHRRWAENGDGSWSDLASHIGSTLLWEKIVQEFSKTMQFKKKSIYSKISKN